MLDPISREKYLSKQTCEKYMKIINILQLLNQIFIFSINHTI